MASGSESTATGPPGNSTNTAAGGSTPDAPRVQGLQLAQKTFAGLLNPVEATPAEWTRYTVNRYKTIKEAKSTRNIFPRRKGYESPDEDGDDYDFNDEDIDRLIKNVRRSVRKIELEMELPEKSLQKCVRIISCDAMLEEVDDIQKQLQERSTFNGGIQTMHSRNGWRSICWGAYDESNGNFGKNWRRIEVGGVDLYNDGLIDICEALFGPLEELEADADQALHLKRKEKLVFAARLLMAVVGIDYEIACEDDEGDVNPGEGYSTRGPIKLRWQLEGLQDKWVARGVRKAAGIELTRDPEEAEKGRLERVEVASEPNYDGYSSEDDEFGSGPPGCANQ
ncbi:hypothetical protein HWV62_10573 [Athelia sp. TMB]|nr:hypothetical protein HWV62_10573 [Athelia sp. TMB]